MKRIAFALLATAALGAVTLGNASALPINGGAALQAASSNTLVQDVRLVCDRFHRCYNAAPAYRYVRPYYAPRYYGPDYYYGGPGYDYGYYGRPGVGVGIGPFGFGFGFR